MQIVIELSEDTYKKLTQKSMLMSASAIDEAVDAIKHGRVFNVVANSCIPIIEDGVVKWVPAEEKGETDAETDKG
jgi:hypothetical protein